MPFMKGRGALRRTTSYLQQGKIIFRNNVRIVTFGFNPGQHYLHHQGLYNFVFWHLPQLKYKNPHTQFVSFKLMTPSPWIKAYLDDDSQVLIDCDSRTRDEIHDHVMHILGKPEETIRREREATVAIEDNPANFGRRFQRQCICEVPGQVPCPGWLKLPEEMTGKWKMKNANA